MTDIEKYSYKITRKIRVRIPDVPGAFGQMATELGKHGAVLGDITKVHLTSQHITRDVIIFFDDEKQFSDTISDLKQLKGYKLISIEDEVLHIHRGGKIAITPTVKVDTLSDLRMVYTPGVAQMCNHIVEHPEAAREYTSIGNSACIATNGSAVLGLGNIGVLAGMPVMEGKSIILNKMAGVSCIPLLIESDNADRIIDILEAGSKTFSVIMIEDIKAPLCFEVEEKLQERVPIPVFHDDQHGTATVILAALLKALQFADRQKEKVKIVISGAGAAGMATGKMLLGYGFRHITICDSKGALYRGRPEHMNAYKNSIAELTNKTGEKGGLKEVMRGKDVFIGVSSSNLVSKDMVRSMNNAPIICALANPLPEIHPGDALEAGAAIALDGRTINNCLVFPGIIRGTLDAGAPRITYPMKFSAAETLAFLAGKHEIVPDFMNPGVHKKIAAAVRQAAL
ncbi:MAG: malic enzyme-like NAD(P)-binding protein [Thermodesulfobacteriota bacterium]|nr:malic enzyme-like NAD(P)-binding protein [Thermodesulfobacteriota bacterium]